MRRGWGVRKGCSLLGLHFPLPWTHPLVGSTLTLQILQGNCLLPRAGPRTVPLTTPGPPQGLWSSLHCLTSSPRMPGRPPAVALFPAMPLRARPKGKQGCAPRGLPSCNERAPLTPYSPNCQVGVRAGGGGAYRRKRGGQADRDPRRC